MNQSHYPADSAQRLRGIKTNSYRSSQTNKTGASKEINAGYNYFRATVGISP